MQAVNLSKTCENIRKFFESRLGYECKKKHDSLEDALQEMGNPKTRAEMHLMGSDDRIKSSVTGTEVSIIETCRCFHYRNNSASEPEGVVCRLIYYGTYPDNLKLSGLFFYGYGGRWKTRTLFKEVFDEYCSEKLCIPRDQKTKEISFKTIVKKSKE